MDMLEGLASAMRVGPAAVLDCAAEDSTLCGSVLEG
jgi:hypothetical protein